MSRRPNPNFFLPVLPIPNNPAVNGSTDLSELDTTEPVLPVLSIPNNPAVNGNTDLSELEPRQFSF